MLSLPEIEQRHHGGLLILGRISFEDLIDELFAQGGELEGDLRVVVGGIAVLRIW